MWGREPVRLLPQGLAAPGHALLEGVLVVEVPRCESEYLLLVHLVMDPLGVESQRAPWLQLRFRS